MVAVLLGFCKVPLEWWNSFAKFFFLACSSARIFFYFICAACNFFLPTRACRRFFFEIIHTPPQELNGRPLRSVSFFRVSNATNRKTSVVPSPSWAFLRRGSEEEHCIIFTNHIAKKLEIQGEVHIFCSSVLWELSEELWETWESNMATSECSRIRSVVQVCTDQWGELFDY